MKISDSVGNETRRGIGGSGFFVVSGWKQDWGSGSHRSHCGSKT